VKAVATAATHIACCSICGDRTCGTNAQAGSALRRRARARRKMPWRSGMQRWDRRSTRTGWPRLCTARSCRRLPNPLKPFIAALHILLFAGSALNFCLHRWNACGGWSCEPL